MVSYDQPGHGRSGRLDKGEYTLDMLGAALQTGDRRDRAEGPGGADRTLDGRHGHHGAGRACSRRCSSRTAASPGWCSSRPRPASSAGSRSACPQVLVRFRKPLLPRDQRGRLGHRRHARPGPRGLDRPGLAADPPVRLRLGQAQPGAGVLCGADELGHPDRVGGPLPAHDLHATTGSWRWARWRRSRCWWSAATRTCSRRSSTPRRSARRCPTPSWWSCRTAARGAAGAQRGGQRRARCRSCVSSSQSLNGAR